MLVLAVYSQKSNKENYVTITVPPSTEPQTIILRNPGHNKNNREVIRIGIEAPREIVAIRSDCKNIPPQHDPNNTGIRR